MEDPSFHVSLYDLVAPVAKTADLICPVVADHHIKAACLALRLCEELGLPEEEQRDIVVAAALHDLGAFSLQDRLDIMEFEDAHPSEHSQAGYLLLRDFAPFARVAPVVKHHHVPWENGRGATRNGEPVARGCHLLHLADRVSVLLPRDRPVLGHAGPVLETVAGRSGSVFVPEFVEALRSLAGRDYVWLGLNRDGMERALRKALEPHLEALDLDALLDFSRLLCRVIDFRSEFTATHTSGLAATALALARLEGFSETDCRLMQVAAYLHDLGKLAVPLEILEKPGKLNEDEWPVMRSHVYYTYQVLEPIKEFEVITAWSALHQERINGSGYPFGYSEEQLPLGARIMAVADVFTGITEDRPYRRGMPTGEARAVLHTMAERRELDPDVIRMAMDHFEDLDRIRAEAQAAALREYQAFRAQLG